jgi:hypothetical protein
VFLFAGCQVFSGVSLAKFAQAFSKIFLGIEQETGAVRIWSRYDAN